MGDPSLDAACVRCLVSLSLVCHRILWEEAVCRDQVHLLINLVKESLLFRNHASLHLSTKVLGRSLGNLFEGGLPGLRRHGQLTIGCGDVRPEDLFVES